MKQPALTPQQKRDLLIASYMDSYKRAGIAMTADQVRTQVIADCELVDAAERDNQLNKPAKDKRPASPREDVIANAELETGVKRAKDPSVWRPNFLHKNPVLAGERWGYACGRIARITTDGKQGKQYIGALGPLAYEYDTLYACFLTRNLPAAARGFKQNQFDGLSDRDAARAFIAATERICDKSTGVLGSWYVK